MAKSAAESSSAAVSAKGSLLDQIMEQTRISPENEGYDVAKRGVHAFLTELVKPQYKEEKVERSLVDNMISVLDERLSAQMDEILHDENFQKLESAWRGLKFLVDRTDFRENIKIEIINSSKEDLLEDFEDAADVTKSGLYKHVYTDQYGQFGGQPIGLVVGNYEFGPGASDVKLLQHTAAVGAMAHAPFVAAAGTEFFNIDSVDELNDIKELEAIFDGPQYAKWRGFRESDDSRNVGLCTPKFLLRSPFGSENPVESFNYTEETNGDKNNYAWGNAAFAMASRINDSFAKYRWSPNIIGPQSGGTVNDLGVAVYGDNGNKKVIGPTEVTLSDRREFELAESGFIALTMRKDSDNACFFSANSAQKSKYFGNTPEGRQAEMNYRLGTQIPYLMIVNRLAHYIKVLQRENLGSWKGRQELESELNKWMRQYIADQDNPTAAVRCRRPLRSADISVAEVPGEAGWYQVDVKVTPHFKFMGANFTLSLTGKLDNA